jgi:molecular chaperone HscA
MLFEIFDPKAAPKPIGIDLGTTNSLVACVRNEKPIAIADCNGEILLPSVVSYAADDDEVVVGTPAAARAHEHPRETIVSVKRFMGRGADDPETRRLGPYDFEEAKAGEPNVVRFRVHDKTLTPVEVSADILRELKKRAEDELGRVGGAVITVPASIESYR